MSDAIIAAFAAFPLIWRILFCVRPVYQGCRGEEFDALRDQTLRYRSGFWHYHDSQWYISVGTGTAIVLRRSAVDLQRPAVLIHETLSISKSSSHYQTLIFRMKNGRSYRALPGRDSSFLNWMRVYGMKME